MTTTTIDAAAPRRRFARTLAWGMMLRWGILAAALALLTRLASSSWVEISTAVAAVVDGRLHLLAGAVVLQVAWAWSLAQISRTALLAVGGTVGRLQALRISMAGFTLSRVVPTGGVAGGVFAAAELTRLGNRGPVALAGMAVSWAVSIVTLATMVLGAAVAAAVAGQLPAQSLIPAAVTPAMLISGIGTAAWVGRSATRRTRVSRALERALQRVRIPVSAATWEEPLAAVADHLRAGRRLLPVLGWSVVSWTVDAASLWLLFLAFDHALPLGDVALGYGFANLLSALPELTPGWIGVYEAAVSATYIGLGAPAAVAVSAVMAYRLISFWLPVTAGVAPLLRTLGARRSGTALRHNDEPQEITT